MYIFITVVIIVICFALGFIVLIQKPKGGGLSSTFGGASNQMFGFKKTTDMIEKWTWGLAIALLVVSLGSSALIDSAGSTSSQAPTTPGFAPQTEAPANVAPTFQTPGEAVPTEGAAPAGDAIIQPEGDGSGN